MDPSVHIKHFDALTQFGAAGLIGALWIWERLLSRKQEIRLNRSHNKIMQQREQLDILITLVRRNTQAIERFNQTQNQLNLILGRIQHDIRRNALAS